MKEEIQADEILSRVRKVVAEVFKTQEDKLTVYTKFMDDLGAESLDIITLLMEFEEQFDRRIPDEDAEKLVTIGDAVDYIMQLLKKPA